MRTRPPEISDADVAALLQRSWGLAATSVEYRPVGFGSHHWAACHMTQGQREQLLGEIDAAAQQAGEKHWFSVTRGLVLHSYFTSEIGMTQAARFVLVPGRWEGCIPLEPGQVAWG